jgi:dTDP-4-dehydrorhamnose 3,5-epimerase
VVDLRGGSPTFGRHRGIDLEAPDLRAPAGAAALQRLLWIPPGFAHGFVVLSEEADVLYEVTAPWDPRGEGTLAWDDRDLGIEWPAREPAVSRRDGAGVALASLRGAPPFRWEGKP